MSRSGALAAGVVGVTAIVGVLGLGTMPAERSSCELLAPGFRRSSSSTQACLVCHDGTVGRPISLHSPSHPADRSYAGAALTGRASLRPAPPPELVLVDGLVVCATCHDGTSPYPHRVAVAPATLCQSCHDR
jgi:hypothetical protein